MSKIAALSNVPVAPLGSESYQICQNSEARVGPGRGPGGWAGAGAWWAGGEEWWAVGDGLRNIWQSWKTSGTGGDWPSLPGCTWLLLTINGRQNTQNIATHKVQRCAGENQPDEIYCHYIQNKTNEPLKSFQSECRVLEAAGMQPCACAKSSDCSKFWAVLTQNDKMCRKHDFY